jgi:K+-transporting ATPase ATPase C chain
MFWFLPLTLPEPTEYTPMFADFRAALRPTLTLLAGFTALTGLAYPLLVTAIAQATLPDAANGSLIRQNGRVIGSQLIAQGFAREGYFHPRPSAAGKNGYDASASSGSNLAPGAKALADRISADVSALRKGGAAGPIPADLVTTSGSGLDPDISPEAAMAQVPRIAKARAMSEPKLAQMVQAATQAPTLGLLGDPHINVLLLNRQLDANGGKLAR